MVDIAYGRRARQDLTGMGYTVRWKEYSMMHEVCLEEIRDIGAWLAEVLG